MANNRVIASDDNPLALALRPWALDLRTARLIGGTATTIALLSAPQSLIIAVAPRYAGTMPRWIHSVFCGLAGVRVRIVGTPLRRGPRLFVANHISWLDIPVIGSRVAGSFVARADMAEWGGFKYLCKLQRTIFVERERRHRTMDQRDAITARLAAGDGVILFPEGTTGCGNSLLPFKSSLFSVAEAATDAHDIDLTVQPVTLAYTHVNNLPLGRAGRYKVAWVGDEDLNPHFRQVARLGRIDAVLQFHEPVRLADFGSRKALAQHCEAVIGHGLRRVNSGRLAELGDA